MSEGRNDPDLFWVDPKRRGIIPLDGFRIARSLARTIRRADMTVSFDTDFVGVVTGCADRAETWINDTIFDLYAQLHAMGYAHSVEVRHADRLVGGVYGVAIGAAFFGESMFSRRTDASKLALAYLIDRLRIGEFTLFDTQFLTPHLARLGAVEITRADYRKRLATAISTPADFHRQGHAPTPQGVIQRNTQTS